MAQAPRGQSGPAHQELDGSWNTWPSALPDAAFLGSRLDSLRRMPRASSTVSLGGQTYSEFDNGRANVLVPADDPLVSPGQLAERRQAISRAAFTAANPLGGLAYGVAALLNASPRSRDRALVAGGALDTVLLSAAPRVTPIRGPASTPRGQLVPPAHPQPGIRYRDSNASGQARGVAATVTPDMLGTGTEANRRLTPPGWQGNGSKFNEARGHLLANVLGGSGKDVPNIVTLTQNGANTPQMRSFEQDVARRVRAGEVIDYSATPLYGRGATPPSAILMTAYGPRQGFAARVVGNPAGRRR